MGWLSRRRVAERTRSDVVLGMVAERLSEFDLPWSWSARQIKGNVLRGSGSLAVVLHENHTEDEGHLDLAFVLSMDDVEATTVSDCISGFGETLEDAWRQGVDLWAGQAAATVAELLRPANEYAGHQHGDDPEGFPGWHLIGSHWTGFGTSDDHGVLAHWAVSENVTTRLAPVISANLDREQLNGVKILFGGTVGDEIAEVRINGVRNEASSAALLALPWPRLAEPVFARGFLLLPHQETDACGE